MYVARMASTNVNLNAEAYKALRSAKKKGTPELVPPSPSVTPYTTSVGLLIRPPNRATTNSTRKTKKITRAISTLMKATWL